MSDPTDMRNLPGADAVAEGVSTATKSFQGFAAEVQKMSKDAIDQTTQTMEKLRGAKSVEDVIAIQTAYMQHSFASYTDYARRFSELMMSMPMEFAKQGRTVFQEGADAAKKATEQAGAQFNQHQG